MLLPRLLDTIIKSGRLTLVDAAGRVRRFGRDDGGPHAAFRLHDRALHRRLALNPKLAFGEAYMEGTLTLEEGTIYDLLDVLALNVTHYEETPMGRALTRVGGWMRWLHQHNPRGRSRQNVAHHYDLSDRLYDLFLDRDRQYSCAYFTNNNKTLDEAQHDKKRHLAAKLLLQPGAKVLDIGSGWGGLGLYLARAGQADVTGVTLSTEQLKVSNDRAKAEGLADRVRFHLRDYRDEAGRYDRIVSVGMFEHVGAGHYRAFFRKLKSLLADDGVAVVHSIGRMTPPGSTNPWLRKYIFPGGYTPALSETLAAIEKEGLWVTDVEILRLHYADTLREWRMRFLGNRAEIAKLYDDRFCRMWEFYLAGCEVAFRRMDQMVFQIQLAKRVDSVPMTRDYMVDWERAHMAA
ncbi:MAG: class I SAM-dependent methyltransferase [Rhodospirillaceae bacterium]|nr:class I SAM-dependent methyltransferase [Rhodospirillaceae bacterium]